MISQQGDVDLVQTVNGGEIDVVNGSVNMSGGLETSVYLSMFGGNENDDGRRDNKFNWWGNKNEVTEKQYRSKTQYLLKSLPATSNNLLDIEDAVKSDTQYLLNLNIASSVDIEVSIPALNSINIKITIEADGIETEFNFTENWKVV